jgi:radical SAM protein with 4Fe4S-binding SPASM domain
VQLGKRLLRWLVQTLIPENLLKLIQHKVLFAPEISERGLSLNGLSPIFKVVSFELRTKCNGKCGFCPVNVFSDPRVDQTMSIDLFEKVVDDLAEMKFTGRIAFFNNNEPLIVKNLVSYVRIATKKLQDASVFHISTNGVSLTPELGLALLEGGINRFSINVYNDNLEAPLPQRVAEFERIASEFNQGLSSTKQVAVEITRRLENEILDNKGGYSPNKKESQSIRLRGFCLQPFTILCINPVGTVSLCCSDTFAQVDMGNVAKERLIDIWEGKKFAKYRKALLSGRRDSLDVCSKCDYLGIGARPGWGKRLVSFATK